MDFDVVVSVGFFGYLFGVDELTFGVVVVDFF